MKRDILFVIDSLDCAGAEKSLVSLLSLLDYSKYNVDLMLFAHGGLLEEQVPKEVNILKPLAYTTFTWLNLKEALAFSIRKLDFKMLASRIKYSYAIRRIKGGNTLKARVFWQSISKVIENNDKNYDIAISYAQGIPTFYIAEKVNAKKKFAWVNTIYRLDAKEREYQKFFYNTFNKIIAVSDSAKEIFLETFPMYDRKMEVIYDINNFELISNLSNVGNPFNDNFDGIRILTIGRFDKVKGYDIALKACKKLKEKGINFRWYVLGKGPLKEEILQFINEYNLTDYFVLLGITANPYPYIKNCNIYVQTSRFEGFGLAIAEARMLNVPVVTTRFDSVYNQMIDGKNGLVVDMSAEAVCDGIIRIIDDPMLSKDIVNYLKTEKKGNVEEIEKFYKLIG
ncbi:glycosyltransferase [Siminovitchia acidinfaciens]|uniref:Glycosyltransferase n=1 Tax=Siminovitchia acidinfaciens TaxID=2321395 RepID=A0A429XW84_9BACI|nr:glycosyltransferase [Siminovitchia acidinfaciens]RST72555.1 glycosyltransferase [Siminovitchia acidinfaciens]